MGKEPQRGVFAEQGAVLPRIFFNKKSKNDNLPTVSFFSMFFFFSLFCAQKSSNDGLHSRFV
jgi:hypothetical protein